MFYKDINVYSPTTRPEIIDVEAIQQSVRNLIFTRPGERLFNIEYGVEIEGLLFELMDDTTHLQLFNELNEKIRTYEPRVTLDTAKSEVVTDVDNNSLSIKLVFEIEGFDGGLFEVTEVLR